MNTTVFVKFSQAPTWLQGKTLYFEFPGLYLSKEKKKKKHSIARKYYLLYCSIFFNSEIKQKFLRCDSKVDNI